MAPRTREVGGGPATGLANDFVQWLSQGLNTGTFGAGSPAGADAYGATHGLSGIFNDLLSGGAGRIGGAASDLITKQGERDVAGLRARFGVGGGTAFGTGAQYAESLLRSETAPKLTTAIGGLQQNALAMLLPLFANIAGKGLSQRSTVVEPNPLVSAIGSVSPLIAAGLTMASGGAAAPLMGAAGAAGAGKSFVQGEWDWMRNPQGTFNPNLNFDPGALARLFATVGGH